VEQEVSMTTLRKKLTAIGVAGSVTLGALVALPVTASAAPAVAPNQNAVKQAAPSNAEEVQRWRGRRGYYRGRRGYGPAIALGAFGAIAGAIAADRYYRHHYYEPYPYHYGYGPRYYRYGW
jgi:hypothetical protein